MDAKQYGSRPAFPHAAMTEQVTVPTQFPGMTVREEFAKASLTGLLANPFYAQTTTSSSAPTRSTRPTN
jgi:hypothetical protein